MTQGPLLAEDALRRAQAVGQYYGFRSFSSLALEKRGQKKLNVEPIELPPLDSVAEAIASFLRQVQQTGLAPTAQQPAFLWHTNITEGRAAPKNASVQFHAIGADRPIADALLIRATTALVADLYKTIPEIRVNSMGDKETRARFARELGVFFKKRGESLSEECMTCAKRDVFEAAEFLIKRDEGDALPSPTDHLSDASRKRFEDLLGYLEATETAYTLAPDLLSRGSIWSETCFEVRLPAQGEVPGKTIAWGSRYSELAKLVFKSALPATGAVLRFETKGEKVAPAKASKSKIRFAFVHIGEEAKHASIKLAEELKKARLPLAQMIGIESLTEQMRFADQLNPPYLLIMGRKEALEGSAVLRNRDTQEEKILPLLGLSERLKAFA